MKFDKIINNNCGYIFKLNHEIDEKSVRNQMHLHKKSANN